MRFFYRVFYPVVLFFSIIFFNCISYCEQTNVIRVMTLNLASNFELNASISNIMKKYKPDLISLQEAIYAEGGMRRRRKKVPPGGIKIVQQIADTFKYDYSFGNAVNEIPEPVYRDRTNRRAYWGPAVLSQLKMKSTRRVPIGFHRLGKRRRGRVLIEAVVSIDGKEVKFYSTHLPPYWYSGYGFSLNRIKRGFKSREDYIQNITGFFLKNRKRVILAGDFNSLSLFNEMAPVMHVLRDAFEVKGIGHGATYPAFFPFVRVDYIFIGSDLEVLNYYRSDYYDELDHRAVIADIKIK